ncbi:MAG: hypothetical protein ACREVN_04980 [Gammaproteobacteria bacterium]
MRRIHSAVSALAMSVAVSATGHAESYDYQVEILYDASRYSDQTRFSDPFLLSMESATSESDDDRIGFAGTWFFDGVAASTGPESRAAFISRASGVSFTYTRGNGDSAYTVNFSDPAAPPSMGSSEQTTNSISTDLRWVWPESGWYGLAGLSRVDSESNSEFGSTDLTVDALSLGIGRYIGAQTALELSVARSDTSDSAIGIGGNSTSATETSVGFLHIGSLGGTWQYGTDIVLSTTDRGLSDGSYSARLSLYPSRPLAFGIELDGALEDSGDASAGYGLFASWFPRERMELEARYGWIDYDISSSSDLDQYTFGIGVNFRF